jgi:anthranilate/para-aminobenzoate synthase component I
MDTERDRGDLAVAIRTFTIVDGQTRLGTGAGIVADSDPTQEWHETQLKIARLSCLGPRPRPSRVQDLEPGPP